MTPTTKSRPAATGRPSKPESGGNRSQTDEAPTKGHNMNTTDLTPMPAWADDAGPWDDQLAERDETVIRVVARTERVMGCSVSLAAIQQPDGRLTEISLDLGDLDGRPLQDPAVDMIETALALLDMAAKYVVDDGAYLEATRIALDRRRDR